MTPSTTLARRPEPASMRDLSRHGGTFTTFWRQHPSPFPRVTSPITPSVGFHPGWRGLWLACLATEMAESTLSHWPPQFPRPQILDGRAGSRFGQLCGGTRQRDESNTEEDAGTLAGPVVCPDAGTGTSTGTIPALDRMRSPKRELQPPTKALRCPATSSFACMQLGQHWELLPLDGDPPTQPPASKPIHRLERFNSALDGEMSCLVALHFSTKNDAASMAS